MRTHLATEEVVRELRSISKGLSKIKYMLAKEQNYAQALETTCVVEAHIDGLIEKIQVVRENI